MAEIPLPTDYEKEHRYLFEVTSPSGPHVVVSGAVNLALNLSLRGNEEEHLYNLYEVHLEVGPYWKDVRSVVPFVTLNVFENTNADEDDQQGWWLDNLTWDAVSGSGIHVDEERIRLKFRLGVKGENSYAQGVAYYLIARGRELGAGGLDVP